MYILEHTQGDGDATGYPSDTYISEISILDAASQPVSQPFVNSFLSGKKLAFVV